jgi:yeast amino acid transporter
MVIRLDQLRYVLHMVSSFATASNRRGSIFLAHIRFRKALNRQKDKGNLALEDLPFQAMFGITGSWIGLVLTFCCFFAAIFTAFPAPGEPFSPVTFVQAIIEIPIIILLYVGYKTWYKTNVVRLAEADLIGGRGEADLHEEKMRDIAERAEWGPIKRVWRYFC